MNKQNMKQELKDIGLSNTVVMSISVAYSVAEKGAVDQREVEKLCKEIVLLDKNKIDILLYLEAKMHKVAPNICEIIGPKIASKLISAAGGVGELAKIPASNI